MALDMLLRGGLILVLVLSPGCGPRAAGPPPAKPPGAERVVRLTDSGARNGQPFFSPDGQWLSFVSDRSGDWQVWVMRPDGSTPRQITYSDAPVGWPSWSADGSSILYYAGVEGRYELLAVDLSGENTRPLLAAGPSSFRPLLSPDGRRLLFDRYGATKPPNHDLFALDLVTGELRQLTDHPGYDSDGRWSPDGRSIVFHSDRDGDEPYETQIYRMAADGADVRRLTSGPARHAYPAWSPEGTHLVYTSESGGSRDLWISDADGLRVRRLTERPGFDGEPVWTPDGTAIVFATDRFGNSRELARLDVGGRP